MAKPAFLLLSLALVLALPPTSVPASEPPRGSGLPLPRFVSLRADRVNLRAGPSVRYPVEWVYRKAGLPMEVVAEFDTWRKVRDWEGSQGWVHQSMLSGKRSFIVVGGTRAVRSRSEENAPEVARIGERVVGRLLKCPQRIDWCRIEVDGITGWLKRGDIWGVYGGELVD